MGCRFRSVSTERIIYVKKMRNYLLILAFLYDKLTIIGE